MRLSILYRYTVSKMSESTQNTTGDRSEKRKEKKKGDKILQKHLQGSTWFHCTTYRVRERQKRLLKRRNLL